MDTKKMQDAVGGVVAEGIAKIKDEVTLEKGRELLADAEDKVAEVKDMATKEIEDLKANAEEALGKAKGYIKENPEKSVAMAAGAGALLAAIAGVFLRKKK
jgi:LPXTG-motif cell wall-anchored protein